MCLPTYLPTYLLIPIGTTDYYSSRPPQRALAALSGDAPPRAAGADSSEKEEPRDRSDKSGAGDGAEVIERIENRDTRRKQVIGRKIQQGDAQYALTYGMMLGIRVLTGRKEMYHSSHDSSDTFELTDDDFLWNMSLEFPPEGTTIDLSPGKRASNKFKVMVSGIDIYLLTSTNLSSTRSLTSWSRPAC